MDTIEHIKERLQKLDEKDIIFTRHAEERLSSREIKKEEVIKNLLKPDKLMIALRQASHNKIEKKYDCYFRYSDTHHHRYIIGLGKRCVVITMMDRHRLLKYLERYRR